MGLYSVSSRINVSDFPKGEESREISPVDIYRLLDPLAARSCSSHFFLSSSLGHQGTALHQEEIDPWNLLQSGHLFPSFWDGSSSILLSATPFSPEISPVMVVMSMPISSLFSHLTDSRPWFIAKRENPSQLLENRSQFSALPSFTVALFSSLSLSICCLRSARISTHQVQRLLSGLIVLTL